MAGEPDGQPRSNRLHRKKNGPSCDMHLPAAFTKTMHDRQCCASGRWYGRSGVELATAGVSMLAMGSDPSADVEARQRYGQLAIGLNAGGDWGPLAFFRVTKNQE